MAEEYIYKIWDSVKSKYVTKNDHPDLNVKGTWKRLQPCKEMMFCISHQLAAGYNSIMVRTVPLGRYEIHKFELRYFDTIVDDDTDPFKQV